MIDAKTLAAALAVLKWAEEQSSTYRHEHGCPNMGDMVFARISIELALEKIQFKVENK